MKFLKACFKTFSVYLIVFILFEGLFRLLCFWGIVEFGTINLEKVIHKYADNSKLIYDMKPSFHMINRHNKEVRTNSHGMRDDEHSVEKPDGVYRIAIVGDSVAFGMYLEHASTFDEVLESKLGEIRPSEVLNFSVSGYNAYQEEIVLKEKVSKFDPDLVMIAHCMNDDSYTDGLGALEREMAPAALGPRLHSKLLTLILHRLERGIFSKNNDPKKIKQLIVSLEKESKRHDYETLVLIFPYKYETLDRYEEIEKHKFVQSLLKAYNIDWIDFLDVWKNKSSQERGGLYMIDDKVHLSRAGMREVSEKLYEYIVNNKF